MSFLESPVITLANASLVLAQEITKAGGFCLGVDLAVVSSPGLNLDWPWRG